MVKPTIHPFTDGIEPVTHAAIPSDGTLKPGSALGQYLIISKLAEGKLGGVYKAQDNVLNRIVALKILPPYLSTNQSFLRRFRHEAQIQARVNNPNVIALHSMLETDAGLVLVMEHVEGQTLAQHIRNRGSLPIDETLLIFEQVLQGIERAHSTGIIHRDLKPANIFITHDRVAKIMNFGMAKMEDRKNHTVSNAMLGTLLYISPEQVNGHDADIRSDIYTVGISLFETLTGRLPFQHNSDYALMNAHLSETPPSPRKFRENIPEQLEQIIMKAIEKNPDKRYQSAAAFRHALTDTAKQIGIELPVTEYNESTAGAIQNYLARAGAFLDTLKNRRFARSPGRRRLIGIAFDAGLLLTAASLVVMLGLANDKKQPVVTPPSDGIPRGAAISPPEGVVSGPNRNSPNAAPARRLPDDSREKDPYESLRKAWGG